MNKKIVTVLLKDLHKNLFVRQALNQEHALYLGELLENGVKLPPIRITREGVVIDGRHRIEAYELNGRTEIEAEIVEVRSENEMIAEAYKANIGGSLPPTQQDTEHTILLLLDRNETIKEIARLLALPPSLTRKYVGNVKSKAMRQKLMKAAAAVTDGGLTVPKAAEQYEVEVDKLRAFISRGPRPPKNGVADIMRNLTKTHRSLSQKNAAQIRSLLEKYEDGDVTIKQVRDIFAHVDQLQKRATRAIEDWKQRFEAVTNHGSAKMV